MSVVINRKAKDKPCNLFAPDGSLIGKINIMLELEDVRLQIKNQALEGYFLIFPVAGIPNRIDINSQGRLSDWPKGFFDLFDSQVFQLLDIP